MSTPSQIVPGLYVGNINTAQDTSFFVTNKIRLVINCTTYVPNHFETQGVKYYRISVDDSSSTQDNSIMARHIPLVTSLIDASLKKNENVLVHCVAGVSRSCTVAAAFMRTCCASNVYQAISMVIAKRPIAFYGGSRVNFETALLSVFSKWM